MKIPQIQGIIRRRILLNYRVDPQVAAQIIPSCFRPKLIEGSAIAGICLIRLEQIRPKGLPGFAGISSENSAHRIAVKWGNNADAREGVFIPRRDTDSRLNAFAGGRLFPGMHHHSKFKIEDRDGAISVRVEAADFEGPLLELNASEAKNFPESSAFSSLNEASKFSEAGCTGYSSRTDSDRLDGLLLKVSEWRVMPAAVHSIRSAFYDDISVFPAGSIEFDHALIMRDVFHEWHSLPSMNTASDIRSAQVGHKWPKQEIG